MTTGYVSVADIDATFHWKIPDFFSKIEKSSYYDPVRSRDFTFRDSTWFLKMYHESVNDGVIVDLTLISNFVEKTVDFTLYLKRNDGEKFNDRTYINQNIEFSGSCGSYSRFKTLRELRNAEKDLVHSGTLTVICHIKEVNSPAVNRATKPAEHLSEATTSKELPRFDTLSSNFRDLFISKEASDVCLSLTDREFQAHRTVLTARSSVFAAMFKNDTSEKKSGIVNIPDCDPDSFEDFLEYLYTGSMKEISCSKARHLYATADKYDVQELKSFCVSSMTRDLAVENVCHVITLADLYEEAELLSSGQAFFSEHFGKIVSSSEWLNMFKKNFRLANKTLENMAQRLKL